MEAGETCEIAGLGPIAVSTAREMLGESIVELVLTHGVAVRNVTHLGRGPTTAQKIAVALGATCLSREGCGRRARLEYDHVDGCEYRITTHTKVDELAPLCAPDHDLKTFHGWALVQAPASARWCLPTTHATLDINKAQRHDMTRQRCPHLRTDHRGAVVDVRTKPLTC